MQDMCRSYGWLGIRVAVIYMENVNVFLLYYIIALNIQEDASGSRMMTHKVSQQESNLLFSKPITSQELK